MPLLLDVEDVVARGDTLMEPVQDSSGDRLVKALDDPDEMLTSGTGELEAQVVGICDVDE